MAFYDFRGHGHNTAGPPQSLRGSRRRGRVTGECPRWAIKLHKQSKDVLIGHPFFLPLRLADGALSPPPTPSLRPLDVPSKNRANWIEWYTNRQN